jgi:hypothetical protein
MTEYHVSPGGGVVEHDGCHRVTIPPRRIGAVARPGDRFSFLPGIYREPFGLDGLWHNGPQIVLSGPTPCEARADPDVRAGYAVLDGGRTRPVAARRDLRPDAHDFAFIKLRRCRGVALRNFHFVDCWPSCVYLEDCAAIDLFDMAGLGGQFFVYSRNDPLQTAARAADRDRDAAGGYLRLHRLDWVQDPERLMWQGKVTWRAVKRQAEGGEDASHFNGALFGALRQPGPVAIRGCKVAHAFNAIRMDARGLRGDLDVNTDILIEDNSFSHIRDNAVEPEKWAARLWVIRNRFFNNHAAISLQGVSGRHWYVLGNTALNQDKPIDVSNTGGQILKIDARWTRCLGEFHVVHNAVLTRTSYTKAAAITNLTHMNNAIGFTRADRSLLPDPFRWNPSLRFASDVCNASDYPDGLQARGLPVEGFAVGEPPFAKLSGCRALDPDHGPPNWTLSLREDIPPGAVSAALAIPLPNGGHLDVPAGRPLGASPIPELAAMLEANGWHALPPD